jgi:biotin carboxylase
LLRIFFNRTYATNAHVISMLRDNPDGRQVQVIGSHFDPHSPVLAACDEAYPEPGPDCTGLDYVEWALAFTAEHGIDVFVPRLGLADLAAARARFTRAGVVLMAPPKAAIDLLGDKAASYVDAAARGLRVPPYRVVTDAEQLAAAFTEIAAVSERICLKPVTGTGGDGYRILTTSGLSLAALLGPVTEHETLERACAALDRAAAAGEPIPPLLVMPFLPGPEVSVDVLADHDGQVLAAIGRSKAKRLRMIVDDPGARHAAETLVNAHNVSFLSNTQVRYWQGPTDSAPQPYLLELNTRMSGGLFQTTLAGVNLAWAAVRLALGERPVLPTPRFGASYTTVSSLAPAAASQIQFAAARAPMN